MAGGEGLRSGGRQVRKGVKEVGCYGSAGWRGIYIRERGLQPGP